ncbi:glycosyltransferase [Hyphomicrobium sp.]|uniref:glycosyltransferase n=1 Tax=Hyphomicrobium sp. TaxID=82 RepID=UPI002E33489D|nr:glycosyltransferase [Hyphomicrobium sp.]HEX2841522.1 glycosyltransferase [Hyphomicrobium sp.]
MPPQQFGSSDPERRDVELRLSPDELPPAQRPWDQPGHDFDATAAAHLDHAKNALRRTRPDLSAGTPTWRWQKWILLLAFLVFGAAAIFDPHYAIFVLAAVLVFPFFCVVALRAAALWFTAFPSAKQTATVIFETDANLPRYTLLVPLYDEAEIAAELVGALSAIDYPVDKLQILLILEELDIRTRRAVGAMQLPIQMSVVVVPDGSPRTKPRALNYALCRATGDLVVIYDAEDVPEPNQLRRAASLLMANPKLGCVQARLNVLNDSETWLTRQFAIEYTVLFDCILPALERLTLPVPLGGTSNHFSKAALEAVGGWDPFNVTEDADLGIRLARTDWMVQVVNSTTWEEAPATFRSWRNQRTRWLKGWMQTYLVHMRKPLKTARDLGWLRFFGLQILMGGLILSALVHPWFYVVAAMEAVHGPLRSLDHQGLSDAVWVLGIVNLILGYATGVALGWVAVAGRGRQRLAWWAILMPIYWLLISFAAYRALYQLVTTPYSWEKTQHRSRSDFATRPIEESGEESAADLA